MTVNQYEIILVNLDPTIGSEIQKTRPCVVISPNEMNHHLRTIVIAPITSTPKKYPTRIRIDYQEVKGMVVIDQIRTIDKQRITSIIRRLETKVIEKIKQTIKETYVK
ncbi:MAG: type II toxin-antitoxin system PemK/MazF family toxin [Saprospiraceae bacterium]|jgi:mRNA interferase MazF|nr:type II toxin-antitoxin system PemK/MazF family toxin [Saprospiraceae bacterium]MBL0024638.1 type II toxin-antitoxin system PemK/MazF family toxin [Saprospiraceae bacterium]